MVRRYWTKARLTFWRSTVRIFFRFSQRIRDYTDVFSYCNYSNGMDALRKFDAFGVRLKNLTIGSYLDDVTFPELLVLYLSPIIFKCGLRISLPHNHLKEASINITHDTGMDSNLKVNIMNDGKPYNTLISPPYKSRVAGVLRCDDVSNSGSKRGATIDFTCASIKTLSYSIDEIYDPEADEDSY